MATFLTTAALIFIAVILAYYFGRICERQSNEEKKSNAVFQAKILRDSLRDDSVAKRVRDTYHR